MVPFATLRRLLSSAGNVKSAETSTDSAEANSSIVSNDGALLPRSIKDMKPGPVLPPPNSLSAT
jgi:hypothetical protein